MRRFKALFPLLLAAAGGLAVGGCNEDTTVPVIEEAEILAIHAAADGGRVDVLVDNEVVGGDLVLGEHGGEYEHVNEGVRRVRVTAVGDTATKIVEGSVTLDKEKLYSLFVVNDSLGAFGTVLFEDDLTEPAAGKALIRIAHMIPDAPDVKLAFKGLRTGAIFDDISFKENTNFFKQVDPGSVTIRINEATGGGGGGGGGGGTTTVVPELVTTLEAGGIYTVLLYGDLSAGTARATVIINAHD
jgi:hypothetical protein